MIDIVSEQAYSIYIQQKVKQDVDLKADRNSFSYFRYVFGGFREKKPGFLSWLIFFYAIRQLEPTSPWLQDQGAQVLSAKIFEEVEKIGAPSLARFTCTGSIQQQLEEWAPLPAIYRRLYRLLSNGGSHVVDHAAAIACTGLVLMLGPDLFVFLDQLIIYISSPELSAVATGA
jgi:hypothetical protein